MSHLGFLNCFEVRGLSYIRRESIVENLSTKRALSQGRILCPRKRGVRSHTTVTSVLLPGINPLPETRSLLGYLWNVKLQNIVFDRFGGDDATCDACALERRPAVAFAVTGQEWCSGSKDSWRHPRVELRNQNWRIQIYVVSFKNKTGRRNNNKHLHNVTPSKLDYEKVFKCSSFGMLKALERNLPK